MYQLLVSLSWWDEPASTDLAYEALAYDGLFWGSWIRSSFQANGSPLSLGVGSCSTSLTTTSLRRREGLSYSTDWKSISYSDFLGQLCEQKVFQGGLRSRGIVLKSRNWGRKGSNSWSCQVSRKISWKASSGIIVARSQCWRSCRVKRRWLERRKRWRMGAIARWVESGGASSSSWDLRRVKVRN